MRAQPLVAWSFALAALVAVGPAAGCERLLSIQDPVAGDQPGSDSGIDARPIDGGVEGGSPILLSEVVVTPTEGEMIEIVNTSNQPVDLTTYYLSDSGNNYFKIPVAKAVDLNDFIVKFPDNTMIPAHGVFTVALDTAVMFSTVYQKAPTFSIADPDSMTMVASNGQATLTNEGEPIILFQWDGHSDLVRDIDIMIVGAPSGASPLTDKSGLMQNASRYAMDTRTIQPQATAPKGSPTRQSTQRIKLEDGHERQDGTGNGQSGDDETSEDTAATWDGTVMNGFGLPTPGTVPAALLR